MKVLKHTKTGRLFLATRALLKHKKMIEASPEEAKRFLAEFDKKQMEKLEGDKSVEKTIIPDDFDIDVDISSFGKPQLMVVGNKLQMTFPDNIRVKELRALVQGALEKARAARDAEQAEK